METDALIVEIIRDELDEDVRREARSVRIELNRRLPAPEET